MLFIGVPPAHSLDKTQRRLSLSILFETSELLCPSNCAPNTKVVCRELEVRNAVPKNSARESGAPRDHATPAKQPRTHQCDFPSSDAPQARSAKLKFSVWWCAARIAEVWPDLEGVVFDFPGAVTIAREKIEEAGFSGRISTESGDFLAGPLPADFDAVLVSKVMHDWIRRPVGSFYGNAWNPFRQRTRSSSLTPCWMTI